MTKSNWEKIKLGDIADVVGGGTPSTKEDSFWSGNVPWLTPKDLSGYNSRYITRGERNISDEGLKNSSATLMPAETVLLTSRAPIGYVAIAKNPISTNQGFKSLVLKKGHYPLFYYYLLKANVEYLRNMGTGSTFKEVSGSVVKGLTFYIPTTFDEQKRIAGILGAFDDKIELLQKQNKTLEDMAKALFKSWFVDFDVVHAKQKGRPKADIIREYHLTQELYDLFPSDFENSSLGPIPLGWQVKTLGDISTCYDSKRIPLSNRERAERQGNYPYYGATSIMDHVDDFLFDGIHLLLGEDGSVVKPEGTPFLQYVFGKIWVNNHAHVLQGKAPVSTEFLYLFLSDVQIQPYVTGAVQAKLNQKNMNSIPVCMATEDFVRQFQGIIEIYFVKIRSNLKQIQTLTELRDTLLPPLISGKIRV